MIVMDLHQARFHLVTGRPIREITEWLIDQAQNAPKGMYVWTDRWLESGIHHSDYTRRCTRIIEEGQRDFLRFLIPTQSYEMIETFFRVMQDHPPYELLLHRIEVTPEGLKAVTYDEETLRAALEMNLEVR